MYKIVRISHYEFGVWFQLVKFAFLFNGADEEAFSFSLYFYEDTAILLTIHPLKDGQKDSRIRSGRWRALL